MIRRPVRWLCVVLPPPWAVTVFASLYVGIGVLYLAIVYLGELPQCGEDVLKVRDGWIYVAVVAYGGFRVAAFHPLFRSTYSRWLEQTPWTSRKPLPLGPVHLVPQDGVVLFIALVLMHDPQINPLALLQALLIPYLGLLCLSFWFTGPWWMSYFLAFGLGLAVRLGTFPVGWLSVLAILYLAVCFALPRALAGFPWTMPAWWEHWEMFKAQLRGARADRGQWLLGWPFDQLRPKQTHLGISYRDGILLSMLAGWLIYALAANIEDRLDREGFLGFLVFVTTVFALVGRVGVYMSFHWPPINIWGRIFTFRWIIPGYDLVFIAPICTLIIAIGASIVLNHAGLAPDYRTPLVVTLVLATALNAGPTLARWRLTGAHRITPGLGGSSSGFIKL